MGEWRINDTQRAAMLRKTGFYVTHLGGTHLLAICSERIAGEVAEAIRRYVREAQPCVETQDFGMALESVASGDFDVMGAQRLTELLPKEAPSNEPRLMRTPLYYVEFSGHYWCNVCGEDVGYREIHRDFGCPIPPKVQRHTANCWWWKEYLQKSSV